MDRRAGKSSIKAVESDGSELIRREVKVRTKRKISESDERAHSSGSRK